MKFSNEQLDKLSDLFMDLAKGLFLAAFTVPAIFSQATAFFELRTVLAAIGFAFFSLKLLELKEVQI